MSAENNQKKSTRGGARANSGRKIGSANVKTREIADRCAESGLTPLEYMLQVLRDETLETRERMGAAAAAAPYIHAKLSSVELSGGVTIRAVTELTDDELAYIAASGK